MESLVGTKLEKRLTRVNEHLLIVRGISRGEQTEFTDLQVLYSRRPVPTQAAPVFRV